MNLDKLKTSLPAQVGVFVTLIVNKYKIDKPLRLAHFLSQIAHESGNFKFTVENLNYSSESLLKVFPKYFKDKATADRYARNPEMIGSRVYANRMGNGDEASKTGFKFRGRGYLQLTGFENYKAFSLFIGEDCTINPDLVATKYPMDSAVWFFNKNNLWSICDQGSSNETITALTKRINGGTHGLADRTEKFKNYHQLLS
jgi:putative chitinase